MKNKKQLNQYPNLTKLKVKIYSESTPHYILVDDLNKVLSKIQQKQFSKYFGVQTCPVVEAGYAMYPHDVEAVLERMFSGKLTGTQLYWD